MRFLASIAVAAAGLALPAAATFGIFFPPRLIGELRCSRLNGIVNECSVGDINQQSECFCRRRGFFVQWLQCVEGQPDFQYWQNVIARSCNGLCRQNPVGSFDDIYDAYRGGFPNQSPYPNGFQGGFNEPNIINGQPVYNDPNAYNGQPFFNGQPYGFGFRAAAPRPGPGAALVAAAAAAAALIPALA